MSRLDHRSATHRRSTSVASSSIHTKGRPAAHRVRNIVFRCRPCAGSSSVSGDSTTGRAGRPSRGEMTSFASAIHVVAQTSWPPRPSSLRPSAGSRRSSRGLPDSPCSGPARSPEGGRRGPGRARNGIKGPSTSRKISGRPSGASIIAANLPRGCTTARPARCRLPKSGRRITGVADIIVG